MAVELDVNGTPVRIEDESISLLSALRDVLGLRSVKDGCSPQGQCGCCTVLVDGAPRVACVTPLRRVSGRTVTTVEGLPSAVADRWADAFSRTGASQCGFCSPGIVLRLVAEAEKASPRPDQALLAHLCRCTGWLPILDVFTHATGDVGSPAGDGRDLRAAARRAELEGHSPQDVGLAVALGRGGFADDGAPPDALVAVPDGRGGWSVGETVAEARRRAGQVQGRRTTVATLPPIAIPPGAWDRVLQTSWVDPAYVETDASWCRPGGDPATALGNGGAFGAKTSSPVAAAARALADRYDRPVRVLFSREDSVRLGPKRPPLAAGLDTGRRRGTVHVARTEGVVDALRAGLGPGVDIEIHEVDIDGPPTSVALRGAGWAEGVALRAALLGELEVVTQPGGGRAKVVIDETGTILVEVDAGDALDETVLRSYCIGAVHMASSWVSSERLTVGTDGIPADLTVRSLGVLRACDMAPVAVRCSMVETGSAEMAVASEPLAVSDAVFAATAAALWAAQGWPPTWPTGRPVQLSGHPMR